MSEQEPDRKPHQQPPDAGSVRRQWIGLAIAALTGTGLVGGLFWAGQQLGIMQMGIEGNARSTERVERKLDTHIDDSNSANEKLADILRIMERRTARLEGAAKRGDDG